jgi:5-methyltetrahydropteroyltriglutamate--homocysteine methyltransferase
VDRARLASSLVAAFARWVRNTVEAMPGLRLQLDEPFLGLLLSDADAQLLSAAYAPPAGLGLVEPALVSVQFGHASATTLEMLGRQGFAVQVRLEDVAQLHETDAWATQPAHVVAVMDGRSVWPDQFADAERVLGPLVARGESLVIVPSTSLMFLPYTVAGEELPPGFQFAREKASALASWAAALQGDAPPAEVEVSAHDWPAPGELASRGLRSERRAAQADLDLPPFPTTSTGSLPQTAEVRHLRLQLGRGEIGDATYRQGIERLITGVNDPYEEPLNPEVVSYSDGRETPEQSAARVMAKLQELGYSSSGDLR